MRFVRALAIAFIVVSAVPGFACSCVHVTTGEELRLSNGESAPDAAELKYKDLVLFLAEAREVRSKPDGRLDFDLYSVEGTITTFHVEKTWNVTLDETVQVESGFPGGGCGFVFETGKRYLVFATREENGALTTNICTRTTRLEKVPDLLEHVERIAGEGRAPRKSKD